MRTRPCHVSFWVALFGNLLIAQGALAWGAAGHEAVCEIAFRELTAAARVKLLDIMAEESDRRFQTFRQACNWPDQPDSLQSSRRPDHFVRVSRDTQKVSEEGCPLADRCLFTAIRRDQSILASSSASKEDKLVALKFLGHWVGDLHQPLHISYRDDQGGNHIPLQNWIGCKKKLHSVWDNCIPKDLMEEMGVVGDRAAFGKQLHAAITSSNRTDWVSPLHPYSVAVWADESYQQARVPETLYCIRNGDSCFYSETDEELTDKVEEREISITDAYEDEFGDEVRLRLQQAGVRLGAMLNALLDP